jgi:hypothetical protein
MRRVARRLGWVLGYGLFLLVVLEVGSRALFIALPHTLGRIPGLQANACWRIRWVQRHTGTAANPYASLDVYHPTRGWALKPDLRDVPVFDGKRLSSNSRGLRGTAEYGYEKPAGTRRIVVLGDSFTFGEEVSDDETMSAVLGTLLADAEVLNFGVHGYGHDQMLLYLQEEALRYHPDVVVLGYVDIDVERNILSFRDYAKPQYVVEDGRLRLTNVPIPTQESVIAAEPYRSKLFDLVDILYGEVAWDAGPAHRRAEVVTRAILDEIRRVTESAGADLVITYMPVLDEIAGPADATSDGEHWLTAYCRETGQRCLSLRAPLNAGVDGHPAKRPGDHWNADEHRIAAGAVARYFAAEALAAVRP